MRELLPWILLLALLLGLLWLRPFGADPSGSQAASPTSSAPHVLSVPSAELEDPSRAEGAVEVERLAVGTVAEGPSTRSVTVSSAAGFALTSVFVTLEGERTLHELKDSQLTVPLAWDDFAIAAPGHLARSVERGDEAVELRPDFLLTLRGTGLRGHTYETKIIQEPTSPEGLRALAMWDFVDGDHWKMAVEAERFHPSFGPHVDVQLTLRGYEMFRALQNVHAGRWVEHDVPLERAASDHSLSPLNLALEGELGDGEVVVHLWVKQRQDIGAPDYLLDSSEANDGVLQLYRPRMYADRTLPEGTTTVDFGSQPLGMTFLASALERETGAFARVAFTHDGGEQLLQLGPGFTLTGRLIPPPGRSLPPESMFRWDFRAGRDANSADTPELSFWGRRATVALEEDGSFRLPLPVQIPRLATIPAELPDWMELHIETPPFRALSFDLERQGPEHHLGDLELSDDVITVLLSGEGRLPERDLTYDPLFIPLQSGVGAYQIRSAAPRGADLELQLHLRGQDDQGRDTYAFFNHATGEFEQRPWPLQPPQSVALLVEGGYERGPDGKYRQVRQDRYEVPMQLNEGLDGPPLFGWTWRGVFVAMPVKPAPADEPHMVRFEAPMDGVAFAWCERSNPVLVEQPLPLVAGRVTIP
ncbi:MAG: hypothetical protein AAF682_10175 [Planctomycetota bacterium]